MPASCRARLGAVDAICINQDDNTEKGHQVESMAKIYAKASRVIVWLVDPPKKKGLPDNGDPAAEGDEVGNGEQALEAIRAAAEEQRVNSTMNQRIILTLLGREWFQRIWVLQEVAAARHILIKCGSTEVDGYAFCSGLSVLKPFNETRPDLQALILPIAHLIRGAVFRRRHEREDTNPPARFSLNIGTLGELVDMYHTRQATFPVDKVYALLCMSSDDPYAAGIEADYRSPWKDLFRKLVDFSLSNPVSVSTWDAEVIAVIEANAYILGEVSSTGEYTTPEDRQHVETTWNTAPSHFDAKGEPSSRFAFQTSAKAIKKGDVVCLLQGVSRPTIIRPRDGFSTIIRITCPSRHNLPEWSDSITTYPTNLLLVWDWDESRRKSQGGKGYESFIHSREFPKCASAECRCQDHLDKAARLWNFGILLNRVRKYEEAVKNLRKAVEVYQTGAELRVRDSSDHGPWRGVDKRVLGMMDDLLIDDKGAVEAKEKSDLAPLLRDAEKGHEAIVQLLLAEGKTDIGAKDDKDQTPRSWAAWNEREAVIQLLLATGKANVDARDSMYGRTPMVWAAEKGHKAVVEMLLATGKADVDARDDSGRTPLSWAAEKGYQAVVEMLLVIGKADVNARDDSGRTPLSWAAENGHEAVIELLLEKWKAYVDVKDNDGRTPLSWAAENGHDAIVKLLLAIWGAEVDAKDRRDRTPLSRAAAKGHTAVIERLLTTEKADVDAKDIWGQTPLSWAAMGGHAAVVERLLASRNVDVDAEDNDGRTPAWWAAAGGHETVVKLLKSHGAQPS